MDKKRRGFLKVALAAPLAAVGIAAMPNADFDRKFFRYTAKYEAIRQTAAKQLYAAGIAAGAVTVNQYRERILGLHRIEGGDAIWAPGRDFVAFISGHNT